MTLCLAAECAHNNRHYVVVASDFESETSTSSAQIQDKLGTLIGGHPVLLAGTLNRAIELMGVFNSVFKRHPPKSGQPLSDIIRIPIRIQKRRLAHEYVGARLGLTYPEFLRIGQRSIPASVHREMVYDIGRITLECSLIIVLFIAGEPLLFRIHEDGLVESCMHFCAIGSGLTLAEASLFHREHDCDTALEVALYHVYEAMRLGSRAPGVGERFAISVFHQEQDKIIWERLSDEYAQYLDIQFQLFGMHRVEGIELKAKWLRRFSGKTEIRSPKKKT